MDPRDKTLTCRDCGRQFPFTVRDQQFYAEQGFTKAPGRCPECRAARRACRDGGHKRGEWMAEVPHDIAPARAAVRQTLNKDGGAVSGRDAYVLREVTELSYRCDALAAENTRLEREKASLLEKVGVLASERVQMKNALAAALGKATPVPERTESLMPRSWWKRIFG